MRSEKQGNHCLRNEELIFDGTVVYHHEAQSKKEALVSRKVHDAVRGDERGTCFRAKITKRRQ